MHTKNQALLN